MKLKPITLVYFFLFFAKITIAQAPTYSIAGADCIEFGGPSNPSSPYMIETTGHKYHWSISGPAHFNTATSVVSDFSSINVRFTGIGIVSLVCSVRDDDDEVIGTGTKTINVTYTFGPIDGDGYITTAGTYNYSVPPIPGVTSYTWTVPSGMSGSSTTNSITLNIPETANSGTLTVKANGGPALCTNTISKSIKMSECIGSLGEYDANKITNRVVSGDFDNDGKEDDVAAFYNYGNLQTTIHMWKGESPSSFAYHGYTGWWNSYDYDANRIVGVVSGDFDRDGFKDDIAAFYDNGSNQLTIHVWRSNGTSFEPMSFLGWFQTTMYDPQKIKGRIVSGDFDRDGYKDDIAAIYDYGNNQMRIHVWQSTGSSFGPMSTVGWFSVSQYDAKKITDRIVSGDFDRDGFEDDIAAFYDYGSASTRIHVWQSTGSSFTSTGTVGWYQNNDYNANKITGKVVAGDFDNDGYNDDVAAFYDYGSTNVTIHVFNSTGSSLVGAVSGRWSSPYFNANKITGRVVSGNFLTDTPNKSDITAFYDHGFLSTTMHVWNANATTQNLDYQGSNGWWKACYPNGTNMGTIDNFEANLVDESINDILDIETIELEEIKIYPNPSNGIFYIKSNYVLKVDVFDFSGKFIETKDVNNGMVDLDNLSNGIYFLDLKSIDGNVLSKQKVVITQ